MFKFRLQTVLEYRKIIEEKMQVRFSETARRLDLENRRLEGIRQERCNMVGILKGLQESARPVKDITLIVNYIDELRTRENRQREVVFDVSKELETKRKDLVESVQKRKILEKLKEKDLEAYHSRLAEQDRKVMDEMGINRFNGVQS